MGIMTAAEPRAEFQTRAERRNVAWLTRGAAVVGLVAALLFYAFPQFDLATSAFFYQGHGVFSGKGGGILAGAPPSTLSDFIRLAFYSSFVVVCLVTALSLTVSLIRKRPVFGLNTLKWLFFATCLAVGPGIVGNVILKDHWGRARPAHLTEFGGSKSYSPPLTPSDQCNRNCSFVAGEASMMYATFFAAAFLFPFVGPRLIFAGVLAGLLSGTVRISQGAHFLSDVIFAGVAMALTVAGIYLLFLAVSRTAGSALPQWCSW